MKHLTDDEVIAIAEEAEKDTDTQLLCSGEHHPDWHNVFAFTFADAIESALLTKINPKKNAPQAPP